MRDDEIVTKDMSRFGYRELKMAGELLSAYKTERDESETLWDGVAVWVNMNSGNVFLCDEDYNVAMMNGATLEDWHTCGYCGAEGFAEDIFDGETHKRHPEWGNVVCAEDGREWDEATEAEDEDED